MAEGGKKAKNGEDGVMVYWERQVAGLCGVHCVNTLLQSPVVSAADFAEIAQGLDAQERVAMAEDGTDSVAYLKYLAEESGNVASDGNFSVQVLTEALKVWRLDVVSVQSPDAKSALERPLEQNAFILNLGSHWFTVRKIGGVFWNLNSLNANGPEEISDFYLSLLFETLTREGYSIFVVVGALPEFNASMRNDSFSSGGGQWVRCVPRGGGNAPRGGRNNTSADDLAAAIAASLRDADNGEDDPEMAAAIAASLNGGGGNAAVAAATAAGSKQEDDAEERAVALSRALSEPEPSATAAEAVTVQIRLRDGTTLRRAWLRQTPVNRLYDFVVGSATAARRDGTLVDAGDTKRTFARSEQAIGTVLGPGKRIGLLYE